MKPTAFEFTITMPGDARLVGAIRGLTAHAAGYARLSEEAGQGLATQVERATEIAIAALPEAAPIDFQFSADDAALSVVISYEVVMTGDSPASVAAGDTTVDWVLEHSRQICHIRQRIPS